jgi:hypothetical protein
MKAWWVFSPELGLKTRRPADPRAGGTSIPLWMRGRPTAAVRAFRNVNSEVENWIEIAILVQLENLTLSLQLLLFKTP